MFTGLREYNLRAWVGSNIDVSDTRHYSHIIAWGTLGVKRPA